MMNVSKKKNKNTATKDKIGKGTSRKIGEGHLRATLTESLMAKKRELERALERLMDTQKEYDVQLTAGDLKDEFDAAQRETSAHSLYSLIERKIKELNKVEDLITSVSKKEKFGLCEDCGKSIPKERLLIIPEATLCVPCQREVEKLDQHKNVVTRTPTSFSGGRETIWKNSGHHDDEAHVLDESFVENLS